MTDYTYEIRNARNMLRVTQAVLIAERTNIQLMVAIKNEMNMGEDIIGLAETEVKLQAKISTEAAKAAADQTKIDEWTTQITTNETRNSELVKSKLELAKEIDRLTSKVTETGATALTIEAQIANEEAQIAIDEANAIINDYSFWLE